MTRPAGGDADLARVGELIGDRTRARMLVLLISGRELSASLLAAEAGVTRSTASQHLRRLLDGGLVAVRADGRHRHFRIADPRVAEAVERLVELAPPEPVTSLRGRRRADQLRRARTCYDHLAGQVGVGVMRGLLDRGHLVGGSGTYEPDQAVLDRPAATGRDLDYRLTDQGATFLDDLGVRLPPGRRPLVRYCVDWTETRHHLAGRLGRGLRDRFLEARWLLPHEAHRTLIVTDTGAQVLSDSFGLVLERTPPS